jgi:hypothetical protein
MPSDVIRIRVRVPSGEAEVEADPEHIREAIELIPDVLGKLPTKEPYSGKSIQAAPETVPAEQHPPLPTEVPAVKVEKDDSLTEIISKFFAESWGTTPRRLADVREALSTYGLNYPKQSVAVSLLRLAKASKIRRFKAEDGEFLYTSSSSLFSPRASLDQLGVVQ